jgi:mannose-1-phosphate guanylyltransferase
MLYMIIEKFHTGKAKALYDRFDENGRMLPEGVSYINSWIDEQISICYQVMESDSDEKIHQWISKWNDIVDFEVIPVISSADVKAKVFTT